jgi:hypothetical protein
MISVAVLAIVGLWVSPPVISRGEPQDLKYFMSFERTVDLAILLLLLAITLFLLWFPVRMNRNIAYYLGGFSIFFLAHWLDLLALNFGLGYRQSVSNGLMALVLICLLALAWSLKPAGEQSTVVAGHRWNPSEMDRLARQLDAINASLGRGSA